MLHVYKIVNGELVLIREYLFASFTNVLDVLISKQLTKVLIRGTASVAGVTRNIFDTFHVDYANSKSHNITQPKEIVNSDPLHLKINLEDEF